MKKKANNKNGDYSVMRCVACNLDLKDGEFLSHAESVHGINKTQKVKKEMVAHMDGTDWFSTTYKFTTKEGFEFLQMIRCTRAEDDMMRYV